MKIYKTLFLLFLPVLVFTESTAVWSQEVNNINAQMNACKSNKAQTWDSARNRCVTKKQDQSTRLDTEACGKMTDIKQREACHLKIAEAKTGLSANTEDLYQGSYNKSMIMNAVPAAYGVIAGINIISSGIKGLKGDSAQPDPTEKTPETTDKTQSKCMSKAILATTGLVGIATDFFMKAKAKKKMESIKKSYALEASSTAYEAQKSAFDYLKKEQETVIEIAGLEKKRNAALILGYGAAMAMAVYEQFQKNPACKLSSPEKVAQ